jgi:hypothetical protein
MQACILSVIVICAMAAAWQLGRTSKVGTPLPEAAIKWSARGTVRKGFAMTLDPIIGANVIVTETFPGTTSRGNFPEEAGGPKPTSS